MSVVQEGILTDPDLLPQPWVSRSAVGRSATITRGARTPLGPERTELTFYLLPTLIGQPWFSPLLGRLLKFLSLEENWNGYGERPVHESAVKKAVAVINSIGPEGPAPSVVPMPDGGVQIEWVDGGLEIEVEIPPSGPAIILLVEPSGEATEMTASAQSNVWGLLHERISKMRRDIT